MSEPNELQFQSQLSLRRERHPRLAGRVAVISGGSGCVGSGIVRKWLKEGAEVIAPVRTEEGKASLLEELEGMTTALLSVPIVDVADEDAAAEFAARLREQHPKGIDHAVSCFGSWWQKGHTTKQPLSELNAVLSSHVASHFVFCKTLLPLMKQDPCSSLIIVTGGAGKRCYRASAGLQTVAVAALYGLIMALQKEVESCDSPIRVNEMRIFSVIKRHNAYDNKNFLTAHSHSNRKIGILSVTMAASCGRKERLDVDDHALSEAALEVGN